LAEAATPVPEDVERVQRAAIHVRARHDAEVRRGGDGSGHTGLVLEQQHLVVLVADEAFERLELVGREVLAVLQETRPW
jgi:hypothetical protein